MAKAKEKDFLGRWRCGKCGSWKYPEDFTRNRARNNGLQSTCKECFSRLYRKKDAVANRQKHVKRYYGLEWEEYVKLFEEQNGECSICGVKLILNGSKGRVAHVDHDHNGGRIRGLLCHSCNAGLGYFRDSQELLAKAMSYLEYFKHKDKKK